MKSKVIYTCQKCGYQSAKWLGKCPDCNQWNSFIEESYESGVSAFKENIVHKEQPLLLRQVSLDDVTRIETGIAELDRVLGGGIVPGSLLLIGGDPGIGKSTISMQICGQLSNQKKKVLYVTGEESCAQAKLRAQRLGGFDTEYFYIVNQTDISSVIKHVRNLKPQAVIIDSIQVMYEPSLGPAPGSVTQVRECAGLLMQLAKTTHTAIFIIGHVTKEGAIAGPRVLEHIVDTVLYFEGDRFSMYRILRAVKNRFGSTNEIGVFEMGQEGLVQVQNPSEVFLSEKPHDESGSAVTAVLEGSRPLLVEIQSLVSRAAFGYPARRAQGFDSNRLGLLVAVLEKRLGLALQTDDIFVNVAGGLRVEDPAVDLSVALAVASALRERPLVSGMVVLGEVGLTGEIRSVTQPVLRIREAEKLGLTHCILPKNNCKNLNYTTKTIELIPVSTLKEAVGAAITEPLNTLKE